MTDPDPPKEALEDLRLVKAVLDDDREALRELAERLTCIPRMLEALNRRTGNRLGEHDIEDLSQDVATLVLEKLASYRPMAPLEGWIYRMCTLQMLATLRGQARKKARGTSMDLETIVGDDGISADILAQELVQAKLEELGPPAEEVIRLKDLEGRTFSEISAILKISSNTAKARYYRGLESLRVLLLVKETP